MSQARFREKFDNKSRKAYEKSLYVVPFKTGKLRRQGCQYNELGKKSIIYVDLEKCPYAEYINRPGYRTRGWFRKLCFTYEKNLNKIKGGKR